MRDEGGRGLVGVIWLLVVESWILAVLDERESRARLAGGGKA